MSKSLLGKAFWLISLYAVLYYADLSIWGYALVGILWFLVLLLLLDKSEKQATEE